MVLLNGWKAVLKAVERCAIPHDLRAESHSWHKGSNKKGFR